MNELRIILASNLITLRRTKRISQKAAAGRCGITDRALRNLETGTCSATVDTLEKLAHGLEVSPEALLCPNAVFYRKKSLYAESF